MIRVILKPAGRDWLICVTLAALAGVSVLLTLNGPGLTIDEPLDVRPGREYLSILGQTGWRFLTPPVIERTYADNKEHPPLGRWLLGMASRVFEPIEVLLVGADPVGIYVRAGRVAPALAFAWLVYLVACAAGGVGGRVASIGAALAICFFPRVFGHAHIAALDMFVACFWTWALISASNALGSARPRRAMARAGLVWGLALLTKIHAWLLPPLIIFAACWRLGPKRGLIAASVWAGVGLAVFFVGWPWLWVDPIGRLAGYLHTVVRTPTFVTYFGKVYADVDVPWHFPWVYFACTVPIGLQALGIAGAVAWWRSRPREPLVGLLLAGIVLWLVVFSTRVPVYDGERLFLPAFALWSIVVGLGFAAVWRKAVGRRPLRGICVLFLVAQSWGVTQMAPFWLSYYNAMVGGLPGAEKLGLELTYWTDAIDPVLLERLTKTAAANDSAALVPTLAPGQGLVATTTGMRKRGLTLNDQEAAATARWVVVHRRTAYWNPATWSLTQSQPIALRKRQGVWLAGIWQQRPNEKKPSK